MGGHAAGEVASKLVIGSLERLDEDRPLGDMLYALRNAVEEANHDLAGAIAALAVHIRDGEVEWGTYHLAGNGEASRLELAAAIFECGRADGLTPPRLVPIGSGEAGSLAARPSYSVLDCSRLTSRFGVSMRPWRPAVEEAVRLMTGRDVRDACEVMRPAYDASDGVDGRVSIEVDPRKAHETENTVAEAKTLWWLVDRENLFIKIPATLAGLPAITATLAEGISVNVTLIFSLERYRAVMDAFLAGLRDLHAAGRLRLDLHKRPLRPA